MQNPYGQPPPGGYGGYGAPPPPQGPPGYGMPPPGPGGGYPMAPMGPATHPCAIISLIAGIVTCIPGAGIAAIICGFVARGAIAREPQRYAGSGMALAGIILGCLHILLGILYVVFVVFLGIMGAASH